MSEEEYLQRELLSDIKHEYIDGRVYAMADASRNHARISGNLRWKLGTHLKHTHCEAFSYGLKLKTGKAFFLIEQDIVDVEVCRRSEGWMSQHYFMGDSVTFESVGITLPVEEIYYRVENDDVKSFLEKRAKAPESAR